MYKLHLGCRIYTYPKYTPYSFTRCDYGGVLVLRNKRERVLFDLRTACIIIKPICETRH